MSFRVSANKSVVLYVFNGSVDEQGAMVPVMKAMLFQVAVLVHSVIVVMSFLHGSCSEEKLRIVDLPGFEHRMQLQVRASFINCRLWWFKFSKSTVFKSLSAGIRFTPVPSMLTITLAAETVWGSSNV